MLWCFKRKLRTHFNGVQFPRKWFFAQFRKRRYNYHLFWSPVEKKVYTFYFFLESSWNGRSCGIKAWYSRWVNDGHIVLSFPFSPPFLMMAAAHRRHYCLILGSFTLFCVKENWFWALTQPITSLNCSYKRNLERLPGGSSQGTLWTLHFVSKKIFVSRWTPATDFSLGGRVAQASLFLYHITTSVQLFIRVFYTHIIFSNRPSSFVLMSIIWRLWDWWKRKQIVQFCQWNIFVAKYWNLKEWGFICKLEY